MRATISAVALGLGLVLAVPASASDVGYIYGRVQMKSGDVFEGELRWGTEESFWDDIFNANKVGNDNLGALDSRTLRHVRANHWSGLDIFGFGDDYGFDHVLAVRFGDLARLDVRGDEELTATFRNGEEMELKGGSNDIGATITVADHRLGLHELKWDRIRSIEFKDTPAVLRDKLGEPIYGTVKSRLYDFTGRIQWDNDECLSIDRLDGQTPDGKMSIPFSEITDIKKHRSGAMVTLRNGEDIYLTGTNDVNGENRGIVVIVPGIGSVRIGWEDFDQAHFAHARDTGPAYADYAKARDLNGTVVTRDGKFDGRIVFDLDESFDFELLQGMNSETEYVIPFRDIARIKRGGWRRSDIELRKGLIVELSGKQDVNRHNDGLLVYDGERNPRYIDWGDVQEIVFR